MENTKNQQASDNLYRALFDLLREYEDCIKRDEIFEVKRKLLTKIRLLSKEIENLETPLE